MICQKVVQSILINNLVIRVAIKELLLKIKIKMNLKYLALIILLLGSLILVFQKINLKSENIKNLTITNYIPNNEEISIISNANTYEINKFIKDNITKNKQNDFATLRNGIYSLMGFDFQKEFKDIYNGEISFSIFHEGYLSRELLLIIKVKDSITINNILNIDNNENGQNKIIELKRPKKINFLKYAFQTEDNYIIFSSNKDLINLSIKDNKSELLKNTMNNSFANKIKGNKLIIFANNNLLNDLLQENYFLSNEYFITLLNYEKNKLNVKSYSLNDAENENQKIYNSEFMNLDKETNLILTNNFSSLNKELEFLHINNLQKEIIKEIRINAENQIIYSSNSKKWLLGFKTKDPDNLLLDKLNKDNNFNEVKLEFDNIKYYGFSKDELINEDNNLIYIKESPIFIKKLDNLIIASNDITYLFNNQVIESFTRNELQNINIFDAHLFIDDQIYINNSSSKIINNTYPFLNKINTFTNNLVNLKVNKIKALTRQAIPELNPNVSIESEIQLF